MISNWEIRKMIGESVYKSIDIECWVNEYTRHNWYQIMIIMMKVILTIEIIEVKEEYPNNYLLISYLSFKNLDINCRFTWQYVFLFAVTLFWFLLQLSSMASGMIGTIQVNVAISSQAWGQDGSSFEFLWSKKSWGLLKQIHKKNEANIQKSWPNKHGQWRTSCSTWRFCFY